MDNRGWGLVEVMVMLLALIILLCLFRGQLIDLCRALMEQ